MIEVDHQLTVTDGEGLGKENKTVNGGTDATDPDLLTIIKVPAVEGTDENEM